MKRSDRRKPVAKHAGRTTMVIAANPTKKKARFLQFDMNEFYPSISEELLHYSIRFAENHTSTEQEEEALLVTCRESILFNDGRAWTKKRKEFRLNHGDN